MYLHLTANLWKVIATKIFVHYQLDREFTSKQYYFYAACTELYNISNKIYADVKHLLAKLQATVPQCPHCKVRHEQHICLYIAYF